MAKAARYQFVRVQYFGVAMPNWLARQSWEIVRESASVVYRPFIRRIAADWGRALVSPVGPLLGLATRLPARCCMLFGGLYALNGVIGCRQCCAWPCRSAVRAARVYANAHATLAVAGGVVTTPSGASFAVLLAFLI